MNSQLPKFRPLFQSGFRLLRVGLTTPKGKALFALILLHAYYTFLLITASVAPYSRPEINYFTPPADILFFSANTAFLVYCFVTYSRSLPRQYHTALLEKAAEIKSNNKDGQTKQHHYKQGSL